MGGVFPKLGYPMLRLFLLSPAKLGLGGGVMSLKKVRWCPWSSDFLSLQNTAGWGFLKLPKELRHDEGDFAGFEFGLSAARLETLSFGRCVGGGTFGCPVSVRPD
jgi:hypothetical protein